MSGDIRECLNLNLVYRSSHLIQFWKFSLCTRLGLELFKVSFRDWARFLRLCFSPVQNKISKFWFAGVGFPLFWL